MKYLGQVRMSHVPNHQTLSTSLVRTRAMRIACTGAMLGMSFLPLSGWSAPLAWLAFVPLLQTWNEAKQGYVVLLDAYLAVLAAYLVAFSWVLNHHFAITALASLGGLLFIPLFTAVPFAVSSWFRRRYGYLIGGTALVAFVLAAEWALSHGPLAFPWTLLGHTQAALFPFNQWAAWFGVPGLSCWVLLLNGAAHGVLSAERRMTALFAASFFMALIGTVGLLGSWQRTYPPEATAFTSALIVQPALPASEWADTDDTARVGRLLHDTRAAVDTAQRPPDLVIWPETALPPSATQPNIHTSVYTWTNRVNVPVLTGAIREAESLAGSRRLYYNSALLVQPDTGNVLYDKMKLVPFAERVPLVDTFPPLRTLAVPAGGVAGYVAGDAPRVLIGSSFALGPLICFESTFGTLTRQYVRAFSRLDFFVALSQDGWWGQTPGYRQHLAITRLRAIETSRAVVVSTVSGISALIGADGAIVQATDWMDRTVELMRIPHHTGTTVYAQYGAWIDRAPLVVTVLFVMLWLVAPIGSPSVLR